MCNGLFKANEEIKRQGKAVKQRQEEGQRVWEEQARLLVEIAAQQKEALRLEVKKDLPAEPQALQSAPGSTICAFDSVYQQTRLIASTPSFLTAITTIGTLTTLLIIFYRENRLFIKVWDHITSLIGLTLEPFISASVLLELQF